MDGLTIHATLIGLTHFELSSNAGHALIAIGILLGLFIFWVLRS